MITRHFIRSKENSNHEYIDLGLSVKWATCNVGANKPEEYGDYFAWGETKQKSNYSESNYSYNANPTVLPLSADAANANWGGRWRMPTATEIEELYTQCTWNRTSKGGINGYQVMGPNGKSIFLPAAGFRDGSSLYDAGGDYWSSSLYTDNPKYAYTLYFYSGNVKCGASGRSYGRSVRPIYT